MVLIKKRSYKDYYFLLYYHSSNVGLIPTEARIREKKRKCMYILDYCKSVKKWSRCNSML